MKRFLQITSAIIFFNALIFAQTADKFERDKLELIRLENATVTATDKRDLAMLDRLIADDFVGTTSRGALKNKTETIAAWTNNAPTNAPKAQTTTSVVTTLNDFNVRINGKTAIVTGLDRAVYLNAAGGETVSEARFTDIWEKRKIGWQLIAGHTSRVQQPKDSPKPETQADLEKEVRKFIAETTAADMSGDAATVNRLLADDYLLTDPYGNVEGRQPSIEFAQSGQMKNIKYDFSVDELKINQYGDTIIASYLYTFRREREGKLVPTFKRRFTEVYVRQNGHLVAVSTHSSILPPVRVAARIDTKIFAAYVGTYQSVNGGIYQISIDAGKLMFKSSDAFRQLFPLSETDFFFKETPATITFVKDANGKTTQYVLHPNNGQLDSTLKKIK